MDVRGVMLQHLVSEPCTKIIHHFNTLSNLKESQHSKPNDRDEMSQQQKERIQNYYRSHSH